MTQSHAQAIAKLFSSSSTTKLSRRSEAFDPTAQSLAYHRKKQKKGSPRLKPSKLKFALVDHNARGKHQRVLEDKKHVLQVKILHTMTSKE